MAVNINGTKLKKCNVNGAKCKTINVNGVKAWSAEESKSNLSASCSNYYEYHTTASGTSSASWDLRDFDSVSFSWSLRTDMSWANGNGVRSTTTVYLKLADGTTIMIGSHTEGLFAGGSAYEKSGTKTVNLTGYTDSQLKSVKLYVTLGDMQSGVPIGNADRHNASASITGAVAS